MLRITSSPKKNDTGSRRCGCADVRAPRSPGNCNATPARSGASCGAMSLPTTPSTAPRRPTAMPLPGVGAVAAARTSAPRHGASGQAGPPPVQSRADRRACGGNRRSADQPRDDLSPDPLGQARRRRPVALHADPQQVRPQALPQPRFPGRAARQAAHRRPASRSRVAPAHRPLGRRHRDGQRHAPLRPHAGGTQDRLRHRQEAQGPHQHEVTHAATRAIRSTAATSRPSPSTTAPSSTTTRASSSASPSSSTSPRPITPGSAAATRTSTACCG